MAPKMCLSFLFLQSLEYRLLEWLELYKEEGIIFSYEKQENRLLSRPE